jgi:hypothetical protein
MNMLTRKTVVLAKIESPYGTDGTPTPAANALLVKDVDLKIQGDAVERDFIKASLSMAQFVRGMKWAEVSFKTELKGSGSRGTLPSWGWEGVLFRACAMSEAVTPATSIIYAPVSTGFESATLYIYKDGIFHKLLGCRGSFKLSLEVGKYIEAQWTFKGLYAAATDATPTAQTFSSVIPVTLLSAGMTIGAYAAVATKMELDINNSVALSKNMNATNGVTEAIITGRRPQGSVDPNTVLEATYGFWTAWAAATAVALNVGPVGSSSGNIITIAAPKLQYKDITYGDQDGILKYNVPFELAMNAGDDELVITIT